MRCTVCQTRLEKNSTPVRTETSYRRPRRIYLANPQIYRVNDVA
jgi:hypothetical protein